MKTVKPIKPNIITLSNCVPDTTILEKEKSYNIHSLGYMQSSVVIKSIIKTSSGNLSVMTFDTGEGLTENTSPFESFAQIIEGQAVIVFNKVPFFLKPGEGIIIPAHSQHCINPNGRFKMILASIKSDIT